MVDHDIAGHNGFTTVSLGAVHALLAKALNGFAQNVDRFCGCVTTAFFLNKFLHFAGYNQNVRHVILHAVRFSA